MPSFDYDLLIVGGGPVGVSLALALAAQPLRIGIIELSPQQNNLDSRALALAFGSFRIMDGIGYWADIAQEATPIEHIHISNRGYFGVTRLDSTQIRLPALGYVVKIGSLTQAIYQRLKNFPQIELICPAKIIQIQNKSDYIQAQITLNNEIHTLSTQLLIAADGVHSVVRQLLQIPVYKTGYDQTAIITNIETEHPHQFTAFERFTDTGPLALLPLAKDYSNVVWTVKNSQAPYLTAISDKEFLSRLQDQFGNRLGKFIHADQRYAFPLQLIKTRQLISNRVVFIGNAAHNLHPVAGQGFNLGLRDVAALAEVLTHTHRQNKDLGNQTVLATYKQWRQWDHRIVTQFTDTLIHLFSNNYPLWGLSRGLGLATLDICPLFKKTLMRQAVGLIRRQPKLVQGLSL
ncbi:2-octaprenyl-6-methoxyphenyl hydroxylase [Candidatus Nitrosacidococcus tergens]|uniref:2-polyprenyl-6-methoxyphenol 4-hydroxylase n=1 Tax=Candidatus Nitrosacidococcus tergens TaxID=553981 RepID=A0A7G1Q8A6_9GAMM|nr:2-octaprenyl-6-methoxyphenyl hydroxylase [Candidatus Nitrosacidococcus tergens]CAB1274540.1 2-polyprenyl-6-methoxyphenol 4-hydroxylase [Candidatus Nitrosacidococcus tergens]